MVFGTLSGNHSCTSGVGQIPWETVPCGRQRTVVTRTRSVQPKTSRACQRTPPVALVGQLKRLPSWGMNSSAETEMSSAWTGGGVAIMLGYCCCGAFVGRHSRRWRDQSYASKGYYDVRGEGVNVTNARKMLGRAVPGILAPAAPHRGGPAANDAGVINERRRHSVYEERSEQSDDERTGEVCRSGR